MDFEWVGLCDTGCCGNRSPLCFAIFAPLRFDRSFSSGLGSSNQCSFLGSDSSALPNRLRWRYASVPYPSIEIT